MEAVTNLSILYHIVPMSSGFNTLYIPSIEALFFFLSKPISFTILPLDSHSSPYFSACNHSYDDQRHYVAAITTAIPEIVSLLFENITRSNHPIALYPELDVWTYRFDVQMQHIMIDSKALRYTPIRLGGGGSEGSSPCLP